MPLGSRAKSYLSGQGDGTHLVLLAPGQVSSAFSTSLSRFEKVVGDPALRRDLLDAMQRFRGSIALDEGAVKTDHLTADGRHEMKIDYTSWHLLLTRPTGIVGCMRYAAYPSSARATDLQIWGSSLAKSREWSFSLRAAIERELSEARKKNFHFGEPGGWVITPELRGSTEAIRLALGGFALAAVLGGAVGVCTATRKNHSAAMLRRLGGKPLGFGRATLPVYFEPHYGCEIEILKFDSEAIAKNYGSAVQALSAKLATAAPVLAAQTMIAAAAPEFAASRAVEA